MEKVFNEVNSYRIMAVVSQSNGLTELGWKWSCIWHSWPSFPEEMRGEGRVSREDLCLELSWRDEGK